MKSISTIFFDLDDTLIDHKGAERTALFLIKDKYFPKADKTKFEKVWLEMTKKNWQQFVEKKLTFEQQRTNRIIEVWDAFKTHISEEIAKNIFMEYLSFYEKSWSVFPDVLPTLEQLSKKDIVLGIISNGNPQQQLKKLRALGIYDFFQKDLIIISESVGFSKPSFDIFNLAQKTVAVKTANMLYIGDNYQTDIEPAIKLKWNALLIDRTQIKSNDKMVKDLSEIRI